MDKKNSLLYLVTALKFRFKFNFVHFTYYVLFPVYFCLYLCSKLYVMPKKKMVHKIVAYDKDGKFFAEIKLSTSSYSQLFSCFLEMCQLLTDGQFPDVSRLDLVGAGHVLFVFCDVRSCLKQLNKSIKIQCYD